MQHQRLAIGELVTIKESFVKGEFIFIWEEITLNSESWLLINISHERAKALGLQVFNDYEGYQLFNTLEYARVKQYQLNRGKKEFLINKFSSIDSYLLEDLISQRRDYNIMAEFLFNLAIQNLIDSIELNESLVRQLLIDIVGDKYYKYQPQKFSDKGEPFRKSLEQPSLLQLCIIADLFLFIKQYKNIAAVAEKIILPEGRTLFETLKQDNQLLHDFLDLLKNKSADKKTRTYFPRDTSEDKPLSYPMNESYYNFIKPEADNFQKILDEQSAWGKKFQASGQFPKELDFTNLLSKIYEQKFAELQKMLFENVGQDTPVEKIVNGQQSIDYNLAFYIPLFRWLMPEIFADNPKLSPPVLRRQHIRHIKDFIAGKI